MGGFPEGETDILIFAQKIVDSFAVEFCDSLQLDYVQPTLPEFAFRYERMRFSQTLGNFFLQVSGIVPCFYQTFQERLVRSLVRCIAFIHKNELAGLPIHSPKSGMAHRRPISLRG
jgi:hypothetical protein